MNSDDNVEIMLKNIISFSGPSYPGRVYGMYEWNESKDKWDISLDWLVSHRKSKIKFILAQL